MRTPLAILNLMHQGPKAAVSIGGVVFALLLVFMQLGFMGAVSYTATNVLEHLRFDAVIRAPDYAHLYEAGAVDRHWLQVARNVPGVVEAVPLWITVQNWRKMPTEQEARTMTFEPQYLPIAIIGFDAHSSCPLDLEAIEDQQQLLRLPSNLLIDTSTHDDYGPWNGKVFSQLDVQQQRTTEVGSQEFRIAGLFRLGTGLAANGLAVMGQEGFARLWPLPTDQQCTLGLLRFTHTDAQSTDQMVQRIRAKLQSPTFIASVPDAELPVDILSRERMLANERHRWLWETPIGLIFQMGVALSLVVGAAIVYMVLATDVQNRLPEYATLLAIGYSRFYLCRVVLMQAMVLALAGFAAAWLAAEFLYRLVSYLAGIPLHMEPTRIVAVAVLGTLMCAASGILALRKLWKAEPASLF